MRGIMFLGIVTLLLILTVKPSSAQQTPNTECLRTISSCLKVASHPAECCPIFEEEIKNERECFCLLKDVILKDPEIAAGMAMILSLCGFTDSFLAICSGTGSISSSPSMPSTPSPSCPTLTPTEISTSPPPAGPPLSGRTPTVPIFLPPSASRVTSPQENQSTSCFGRIWSCLEETSMMGCCPTLKQEIENERECLCSTKDDWLQNPQNVSGMATFLSDCGITDSLETICSRTGPPLLSPTPAAQKTLPPTMSPDVVNSTSSLTTSARVSGSTNKLAYSSIGLLPSSLLIIWAIMI